jgi:hypothetical protein
MASPPKPKKRKKAMDEIGMIHHCQISCVINAGGKGIQDILRLSSLFGYVAL